MGLYARVLMFLDPPLRECQGGCCAVGVRRRRSAKDAYIYCAGAAWPESHLWAGVSWSGKGASSLGACANQFGLLPL